MLISTRRSKYANARDCACTTAVTGARLSTLLMRMPYLPAADALVCENGKALLVSRSKKASAPARSLGKHMAWDIMPVRHIGHMMRLTFDASCACQLCCYTLALLLVHNDNALPSAQTVTVLWEAMVSLTLLLLLLVVVVPGQCLQL